MDTYLIALVLAGGAALGVVVWVLAKLGKALIKIAEALAAAAVVLFTVWLVIKAVVWALRQVLIHWRTSLTVLATFGVVAVVGLGFARSHCRCGRWGAHRVAAGRPGVL
jgi:hypothetical protein